MKPGVFTEQNPISNQQILELIPQQRPFRFVDELLQVNSNGAVGKYTFRKDETFYAGHFPGNPLTPGVILLETMAQVGLVALGIYLMSFEISLDELKRFKCVFTDGSVEFLDRVLPGDTVVTRSEKIFWRKRKLRSKTEMYRGEKLVVSATVAGMVVNDD